ncbi:HAD-IIB family hydrolase [Chloroflexota bacterium]
MLKEIGYHIKGFGDMTVREVAAATGLDLEMAALAKQREYNETLVLDEEAKEIKPVLEAIQEVGLAWMHGGRFYNVTGGNDKGEACQILIELLRKKFTKIKTIGIGDSANDLPMLRAVDIPVLVQKESQRWEDVELPGLVKIKGAGPRGWREAIFNLIESRHKDSSSCTRSCGQFLQCWFSRMWRNKVIIKALLQLSLGAF